MENAPEKKAASLLLWGLLVLSVAGAVGNWLAFHDYHFEDSYITYRYAENLATGRGFAFNEGERVLGTSTPSWTLLLAAFRFLGVPIPWIAGLLFAVLIGLSGFLGSRYLHERDFPVSAVLFCLATAWGAGEIYRYWGMETALYLAAILASLLLTSTERRRSTGLMLGLVAITRYDGIVPVGLILAARWWKDRKIPWTETILFSSVLAAWLGFATWYFGGPLPQTFGAKTSTTTVPHYLGRSWDALVWMLSPFGRLSFELPFPQVLILIVWLVVALAGLWRVLRTRPELGLLLAIATALTAGYAIIGPPPNHLWYQVPTNYCLLALGLASVEGFVPTARRSKVAIVLLGISLCGIPLQFLGARADAAKAQRSPIYQARIEAYDQMADWVRRTDSTDLTLLTNEPGYLGFLTGQPAIDGAGLVTRGIQFHGPRETRSELEDVLREHEPDLVVHGTFTGYPEKELAHYRSVLLTPRKDLLMARTLYRERFDRIWAVHQDVSRSAASITGPIAWAKYPPELRRVQEGILVDTKVSSDGLGMVWSEPFRIDHDELRFDLVAPTPKVLAQLIVDGQLVYEALGGRTRRPDGAPPVRWSLAPFRGRTAVLRFSDTGRGRQSLLEVSGVAVRSRTSRTSPQEIRDWIDAEGRPARELAENWGLEAGFGPAVTTLGRSGAQVLESPEFTLEQRNVSLVLHRTTPSMRVELHVGGRRFRRDTERAYAPLLSHHWFVDEKAVGRPARIVLMDDDPDPNRGVGLLSVEIYRGFDESIPLH